VREFSLPKTDLLLHALDGGLPLRRFVRAHLPDGVRLLAAVEDVVPGVDELTEDYKYLKPCIKNLTQV
jgi:hypothetical protein